MYIIYICGISSILRQNRAGRRPQAPEVAASVWSRRHFGRVIRPPRYAHRYVTD